MHALHSGTDVKAHAASVGQDKGRITVQREVMAARLVGAVLDVEHGNLAPRPIVSPRVSLNCKPLQVPGSP